jgi:hypothetical protein
MNRDTRQEQISAEADRIMKENPNLSEQEVMNAAKSLVCSVRVEADGMIVDRVLAA